MLDEPARGLRFLIFGGDALVALDLADLLTDLGHIVVATENRFDRAEAIARTERLDVAIQDIKVRGQPTFARARILQGRGVRVIFASCAGPQALSDDFRDAPVLIKPFCTEELAGLLARTCGGGGGHAD